MRSILVWFIPLVALAAALCLMTGAACGGNDGEKQNPTETVSAPSANGTVSGQIETAARKLLAEELAADAGAFSLESPESVHWSDASLGCPQEGMMYAQVITPGYKLMFDHADASYAVHTNSDGSHMVVCSEGQ